MLRIASSITLLSFILGPSDPPRPDLSDNSPFSASRGNYASIHDACSGEVERLVEEPTWARPIAKYCDYRTKHATRGQTVVSRIDGSQVHDRDRPAAWRFYRKAVRIGVLDPDNCVHHRVEKQPHPRACRRLAENWPFRTPRMTPKLKRRWLGRHHGFEKFSTRGPHDNTAYSYIIVPGCWPMEWLDDPGVAAEVTVRKALQRCGNMKRCTFSGLREVW